MIGEIALAALAEAIVGVLIESAARRPALQRQLEKIRGDSPETRAVKNSLRQTTAQFEERHPDLSAALFDDHFLKQPHVARELAMLLLPGRTPDIDALDHLWRRQLSGATPLDIKPAIADFVNWLERAYKDEPDLLHFIDSRNLDSIATTSGNAATHTERIANNTDMIAQQMTDLVRTLTPAWMPAAERPPTLPATSTPVSQLASIAPNPFTDTTRINDPARFFGRRRIVRDLQQALRAGNSTSLVGDRLIGKSSLLYFLYRTQLSWQAGRPVHFLNMQSIVDEEDFCGELLELMGEIGATHTLRTVRKALGKRPIILLLDEIERLRERDFRPFLQDFLRGVIDDGCLTLMTASHAPLATVFPPRDATSPLHNAFTERRLPPFTEDEARQFLTLRLHDAGVTFSEGEVAWLFSQSGGNPGQLQRAARILYEQKASVD